MSGTCTTSIALTRAVAERFADYRTLDGAFGQRTADLWCSYAAVRGLKWLGIPPADVGGCLKYLRACQTREGGFAWQRGLAPDIWATYYCTQSIADVGQSVGRLDALRAWVSRLRTPEGGYSMTPGQSADLWATYYAVRTITEVLRDEVPEPRQLRDWLEQHQHADGGIGWTPMPGSADVRACYYAVHAAHHAGLADVRWSADRLVRWLQDRQHGGGFSFTERSAGPCLWATFRAVRALAALGAAPRSVSACAEWIRSRQVAGSGFERWPDYGLADVWACFSAVGAAATLGVPLPAGAAAATRDFLASCQVAGSGFTYQDPSRAGDALATAAACIALLACDKAGADLSGPLRWLRFAQMGDEGGVMYMPARGAETRSTLWAVVALSLAGQGIDRCRLGGWLTGLQNSDGGFGIWEGRASDVIATAAAVEASCHGGAGSPVDLAAARRFVTRCCAADGVRIAPRSDRGSLPVTCAAARALQLCGSPDLARSLLATIPASATRWGGYSSRPGGVPDLLSTYSAVSLTEHLGAPWDPAATRSFLGRVRGADGHYAWSPLTGQPGGPLADCYGSLLEAALISRGSRSAATLPYLPL